MGIAQKIKNRAKKNLLDIAIKSKNRAKQFLRRRQMTKITIKLYFFFFFFFFLLLIFFSSLFGGTMAHLGLPSLRHCIPDNQMRWPNLSDHLK
jgi:hypothetical protein